MTEVARGTYHYWRDGQPQDLTEPWAVTREGNALVLRGRRLRGDTALLEVEAVFGAGRWESMTLDWQPGTPAGRRVALQVREGTLLFPLLRAATGPLLQALSREPADVLLPSLHGENLLQPIVSPRRATQLGDEPGLGRHYRYFGGEYGESGSDWWLDGAGFVRRYRWDAPDGEWDVRLANAWLAQGFEGFAR